jgi:Tfp pilus assembly protein PilP
MNQPRSSLITALLLCAFVAIPAAANPQAKDQDKAKQTDIGNFSYSSVDRRDPFEPVYLIKIKKTKPETKKTGYELEELRLVGVLKTGAVTFAMMEDIQGKGLLFKKGDFLNKNLWVLDVLEEKMVLGYKLKGDVRKIAIDIPRK